MRTEDGLRRPGTERAPGLFLISFDHPAGSSIDFMADVCERVGGSSSRDMSHTDYKFCRELMADEQYRVFRRRKVPPALTNGATVYAIDLLVSPLRLAGRHIADEMLVVPCMAEPGDAGAVMQMPYWLITGTPPPGAAEQAEFHISLASVGDMTAMTGQTPPTSEGEKGA